MSAMFKRMIKDQRMYSKEEKIDLILKYQETNDPLIAEDILKGYYKLIIKTANSVKNCPAYKNNSMITVEDLVNNGIIGMYAGFHKINTSLGTNIDSYIMKWAREYMYREVREMFNPVHVPVGKLNATRKLDRLIQKNNGDIDSAINDFFEDVEGSVSQINKKKEKLKKFNLNKVSVSSIHTFENDDDGSEIDIKDVGQSGLEYAILAETAGELEAIFNAALSDTEKYVIKKHFGMLDNKKHTYESIATELGVTRMRVCQIAKKSLAKMKRVADDRSYNNNKYED